MTDADRDLIDVLEADLAYWEQILADARTSNNPFLREEALDSIIAIRHELRQLQQPANRVRVITRRAT